MKIQRVWAIFYRVRSSTDSKWCNWVGPCGVYVLNFLLHDEILDALRGRPFFFRTRKQARIKIREILKDKNISWTWVQYKTRPIKLTYEVIS